MKLALFDFDHTLINKPPTMGLLEQMESQGAIPKGYSDKRYALREKYRAGELTYNEYAKAQVDHELETIKGMTALSYYQYMRDKYDWKKDLQPWVNEMLSILQENDYLVIVITGSHSTVIEVMQETLDIDAYFATRYEIKDGKFTGKMLEFMNAENKCKYTKQVLQRAETSIGVGDAIGDIPMLLCTEHPFILAHRPDTFEELKKPENSKIQIVTHENILEEVKKVIVKS